MQTKTKALTYLLYVGLSCFSTSVMAGKTDLIIRGQDDCPDRNFSLRVSIPDSIDIEDGPKGDKIQVVSSGQKATKDQRGNFCAYYLNRADEEAPVLYFERYGDWRQDSAVVSIMFEGRKWYDNPFVYSFGSSGNDYLITGRMYVYRLPKAQFSPTSRVPEYRLFEPIRERASGSPVVKQSVEGMPFFDDVSTFGTVWHVFNMFRDDVATVGSPEMRAKWANRKTTRVYPSMTQRQFNELFPTEDYQKYRSNAFYNDMGDYHILCFFPRSRRGSFTSESFDVIAHETGHNGLNILRPDLWGRKSQEYEISAFHEAFGDATAFFAVLSFPEMRDAILKVTGGDLTRPSFLSKIGEGIVDRDVAERTDLSRIPSCEEHALSVRLTKAIYGTLANAFAGVSSRDRDRQSELLEATASGLRRLFLQSTLEFDFAEPNFANFGRMMRKLAFQEHGYSSFYKFINPSFTAQGIDLDDTLWATICVREPSSKAGAAGVKLLCSTNFLSKRLEKRRPVGTSVSLAQRGRRSSTDEYKEDGISRGGSDSLGAGRASVSGTGSVSGVTQQFSGLGLRPSLTPSVSPTGRPSSASPYSGSPFYPFGNYKGSGGW